MIKMLLVIGMVVGLTACDNKYRVINESYNLPSELSDCKLYRVSSDIEGIVVVRCPNSTTSTTYHVGKTTQNVVVIDGEKYEKSEN